MSSSLFFCLCSALFLRLNSSKLSASGIGHRALVFGFVSEAWLFPRINPERREGSIDIRIGETALAKIYTFSN